MPLDSWAEFGIAGLAVAGSFWLMSLMLKRADTSAEQHAEERREWRKSADESAGKVQRALDDLAQAIRNMRP